MAMIGLRYDLRAPDWGPASLAEVYTGRYSTLDYFADERTHRTQEAGQ